MKFFFDIHKEFIHLPTLITEILNDPIKLSEVAKASYHHTLGFDKMVLKENVETGDKLRLHFWWPEAPEGDDDIHPHRWDFSSIVLVGEIKVQKYAEHPDGDELYQYIYFSPLKNESYKLTPCGTNKVILSEEFNVKTGENYSQRYDERHRVTRMNDFVVTLLTQGPVRIGSTKILSRLPIEGSSLEI